MKRSVLLLLATCCVIFPSATAVAEAVRLHFFYAENCAGCREQKPYLDSLRSTYPQLELVIYDVWMNQQNYELMQKVAETQGVEFSSTPTTALGQRVWFGFNHEVAREIEEAVEVCLARECPDLVEGLKTGQPLPLTQDRATDGSDTTPERMPLPIDPEDYSLPAFTIVVGLLDSFNPCAFFVLLFLLSLMVHTHSRRRMLLVGGVFIFFSGLIYFLFMAAWLNLFLVAGQLPLLTFAAGVVALLIAILNIKDHFFFKQGPSLSITESAKPKLATRMRNLLKSDRLWPLLTGTSLLAVVANSYELLCTAGFPMVYTRVLTMHQLPAWLYYSYLALYNLTYILPLLLIVTLFSFTLGSHKLTEFEGRALKLVSGLMMLTLGLILLIQPLLLQSLFVVSGLLVFSVFTAGVTILIEKNITRNKRSERLG